MKVIQIVPDIENMSAGPAYSVPAMTEGLRRNNVEVELFSLGRSGGRTFNYPVRLFQTTAFSLGTGWSPSMLSALKASCKQVDIVHTNSIWMFPNVYPSWAAKGTRCKVVIGPRGTVSEWALQRSQWKKYIFGHLFQYPAMRRADMFVATCEDEAYDIRRMGYSQPIAIIPNGVDVPNVGNVSVLPRRRMFFLSRIHPKKNVEMLIRCWARIEDRFSNWDLSIVGPDKDNPYAEEMKILGRKLNCKRIRFEGEINGYAKYRFIAESECEILPTHSENFGMVVAESLACGTPVICTRGAPWRGLIENCCGWWVDISESALEAAMVDAMSKTRIELSQMGKRGEDWMRRDFDWVAIGRKMRNAYEWLLGGVERPDCVMVD